MGLRNAAEVCLEQREITPGHVFDINAPLILAPIATSLIFHLTTRKSCRWLDLLLNLFS